VKRTDETQKSIINLPHPTVHEQMNVAYTRKRVEIYMEKLLFKPTRFTKNYSSSHGLLCLTEPKVHIYFITLSHINPVKRKRMEDQRAYCI
jgi:hypothetical protein